MADPKPNPEIIRQLFESIDSIHIVCIHPNGLKIVGKHFENYVDNAIDYCVAQNNAGLNVYWTPNIVRPNVHKKAKESDITAGVFSFVDIDPPKNGGAFDRNHIIEWLSGIDAPPSFIIDSGGGLQAFWRLDEPCANIQSIKYINTQIRDYFDADNCQSMDHVMRVPGTVNYPDAKKRARGRVPSLAKIAVPDDGVVYEPHKLSAAFPPAKPQTYSAGNEGSRIQVEMPDGVQMETADTLVLGILDHIREAINSPRGQDRSADGMSVARKMANAGHTDAQIIGVLLNPDNPVSAHFVSNPNPQRAALRVISEVRKDSPEPFDQAPTMSDEAFQTFVTNMRAKAEAQAAEAETALEYEPIEPDCAESEQEKQPETDWLEDLGDNPIGQFVRFVCATATRPQPFITLGAALTVFGTAAGRRYASPTDLRTNLYAIGICDSGGGKDRPLKAAINLMVDAGQQHQMGGSKIASGQAMVTDVTNNPALMYAIDEVGFLISSAADRKRAPKHATEIMDNLTEFYSKSSDRFLGTSYADQSKEGGKPRKVIEQPCLSLFGVTTPGVFWGSLTSSNVMDGSLARMVIFQSENDYPDPQYDVPRRDIPANLVMALQNVVAGAKGHQGFPLGEGPQQKPKPYVVPYADEKAKLFYVAMREEENNLLKKHRGTNQNSIIARFAENATKIALIRAIAGNPAAPVLTEADLKWGKKISWQSVASLLKAVREKVADNDREGDLKRHLAAITDAGKKGATGTDLSQAIRGFDKRRRIEILEELNDTSDIISVPVERVSKTGKQQHIHFDIKHAEYVFKKLNGKTDWPRSWLEEKK